MAPVSVCVTSGFAASTEKAVPSPDQTLRPADVFLDAEKLCIGISITHVGAETLVKKAATTTGSAADGSAKAKNELYTPHTRAMGLKFTPFIFETFGYIHASADRVIKTIAEKLAASSSVDLALATARIRQRFAACVAREIAGQIIARSTPAAEYVPTIS